jgi:seryl-tRNA synthetase
MGSQEKAFYKMLDKYSADLSTKHKAELALMKDNFSKERLTLLKKLEQLSTELAAKQKSMQDLNKKLEAIEKLTIPVSKAKTVNGTKSVVENK